MRIAELLVAGFGRFRGRRLSFGPGLNVVYGPNESGKTTLQLFLLGMLYGLKKRGQRREASDEALRYRPWQGGDYRGVLTYQLDDGRSLRVERLFEPGRDQVRVFDAATGEELTGRFSQDRRKEVLFAEAHLGLSEEAFRSTAWVGQLAVGKLDLGRELVARVANLQESGREDVSVKAALEALEEQARAIGSERAPTRPLGRVLRSLAEKRQELERAEAVRRQVHDWEAGLSEAQAVLAELEAEMDETGRRLDWALLAAAEARLGRSESALQQAREARSREGILRPWAGFPAHQLERLRRELGAAEGPVVHTGAAEAEVARLETELAAVAAELNTLEPAAVSGTGLVERLEELERQMAPLRRRSRQSDSGSAGLVWAAVGGLLLAASAAAGALGYWWASAAAGAAAAGCLGLWWRIRAVAAGQRKGLTDLERERDAALAGLGVTAAADIRTRVVRYEQLGARREGLQARLAEARAGLERTRSEETRRRQAQVAVDEILTGAGVAEPEEFEAGCARRLAWEQAAAEARAVEAALSATLDGEDAAELTASVEALRSRCRGTAPDDRRSPDTLREDLRRLEARRAELTARRSDLSARMETTLLEAPETGAIRQELADLEEQRRGHEEELAAIELASATLRAVSAEVHREFAPQLHRAMGRAAMSLTGGRYRTIRVDEEAAIRVVTQDDRTVGIEELSGGTADQLYLGLRLALLDLLTEGQERCPLLLDDPFVQYDDRRAEAAVEYLARISRERQVILLTCHLREAELARHAGVPFHLVELADAAAEANP